MSTQPTDDDEQVPFDDELAAADAVEDVVERAKEIARERAEADAPDDFCGACQTDTPLAYNNASDIATIRLIDNTVDAARDRLREINGPENDDEDTGWWIRMEVTDEYFEAFYPACADPTECEVCRHPDAYGECGHERHGETCPARGGDA